MTSACIPTILRSLARSNGILARDPARKITAIFLTIAMASPALAKRRDPDYVTLSGYYSQYNLRGALDPVIQWPTQSADAELAVRVFSIVSIVGSLANSIEPDMNDAGASPYRFRTAGGGIKIDIPGLFFIGAEKRDYRASTKSHPFNLFFVAEALLLEMRDIATHGTVTVSARRAGFGLDIFPFVNLSHFTIRALAFNYANSTYVVTSFGGGVTF